MRCSDLFSKLRTYPWRRSVGSTSVKWHHLFINLVQARIFSVQLNRSRIICFRCLYLTFTTHFVYPLIVLTKGKSDLRKASPCPRGIASLVSPQAIDGPCSVRMDLSVALGEHINGTRCSQSCTSSIVKIDRKTRVALK